MRPTRVTPVTPKPTSSTPSTIYGSSDMPSLERNAAPAATVVAKGIKQEQMEKELSVLEGRIKEQATLIQRLKVQIIEDEKAFKDDKEKIYSKGTTDGETTAKEKFEDEKKKFEIRHDEMQAELRKAQARYPELKKDLEADIVRRENKLALKKKEFDRERETQETLFADERQRIESEYREANQFDEDVKRKAKKKKDELDERDRDLTIKETSIRTRKAQRSDYNAYRRIWNGVREERKSLEVRLRTIAIQLVREGHSLSSNAAASDQARLTPDKLKELESGVEALREDLNNVDKELGMLGHNSRRQTRATRFDDTRLAARSMASALYLANVEPLRSVRTRSQQDIEDTEAQIQAATNATTREELKHQKDAFQAEKVAVNTTLELAFLDSHIQVFETLQHEPYVHKAVHLATFDLQAQVDTLYAQSYEGDKRGAKPPKFWNALRDTLRAANVSAKRTALLLEMKGGHQQHEKQLDAVIVEKLARLNDQLQMKRGQLLGHHKLARAAAKRAPPRAARAWGATSSSAASVDVSAVTGRVASEAALYKENCEEKARLLRQLCDTIVSLDTDTRAERVRRFTQLSIQTYGYEIKANSKKLISSPRKPSEVNRNRIITNRINALETRRDRDEFDLEHGNEPYSLSAKISQKLSDGTKSIEVVAGSNESPLDAKQDDTTNISAPFNEREAQEKLRTLKRKLEAAKEARDHKKSREIKVQIAALKAAMSHGAVQAMRRHKAALGEVTPENAEKHRVLDHEISKRCKPQTRRQRLMNGPTKVRKPATPQGHKQKELERELRELSKPIIGLSDDAREELRRLKQIEKMQIRLDLTRRSLEKLGSRTADNELKHESITQNIIGIEAKLKALQNLTTGAAAGVVTSSASEDKQLDDLMAAWSSDDDALDELTTPSTTEPTVTSEDPNISNSDSHGLNMKPTSARQETHQPSGRRDLHNHQLWTDFLNQQESREGRALSALTTGAAGEIEDRSLASEAGAEAAPDHVSGIPSSDCAAADDLSNLSTEAARDDGSAKNDLQTPASLSPETTSHLTSSNNTTDTTSTMAEPDEGFVPTYEISPKDKKNALIASRNSTASFWRYSLYKNAAGIPPTRHYCTTFEQTEAQVAKFLGEKVVGFDLEWEMYKSKPGQDSAKRCVSLMQIAAEDKVALFHLAMFKGGDSTGELMPPSLRAFLENPEIIKVGVNIGGDASRLKNCFGVEMKGNIELSHLYKLVTYGESDPTKVNRVKYALASQVQEVLHLPLSKGAVRTSSWSKRLNAQQTDYAASDAYAGLRLYYELERRRKAMVSKPPRPAFQELNLPILLGGGELPPTKSRRGKQPIEAPEESIEEAAALQEQDDGDVSEESEDFYDDPEDLEAFDAYVESQDAEAIAGASLPEIKYPTLPPLEDLLDGNSDLDDRSSLPSDPIAKPSAPSRTPNLHTPEAVTADAWATAWRAQLPATYNVRASQASLRAYNLWHHQGFDLKEITALLRKEPLALSTVVSYISEVLQKEDLEFDAERVRELRARLPSSIRGRYTKLYADAGKDEA